MGAARVEEASARARPIVAIGPLTSSPARHDRACIVMQVPAIPSFCWACFGRRSRRRSPCRGASRRHHRGGELRRVGHGFSDARRASLDGRHRGDAADHLHRHLGHGLRRDHAAHGLIQSLVDPIASRLRSFSLARGRGGGKRRGVQRAHARSVSLHRHVEQNVRRRAEKHGAAGRCGPTSPTRAPASPRFSFRGTRARSTWSPSWA